MNKFIIDHADIVITHQCMNNCPFGNKDFGIQLNKNTHKEVTFENSPITIEI